MATYAIGDVQGCMASLERLLALIDYQPGRDALWLVGDLVNRGPRSLDVLRWARAQPQLTCVLGNHDLHLLARAAGAPAKRRDTLEPVLAAPDRDELVDWLRTRPLLAVADGRVLIHAGLHPSWDVALAGQLAGEVEAALAADDWRDTVLRLDGVAPDWRADLGGIDRLRATLAYLVRARCCHPDGRLEPTFDGPPAQAPPGCVPWFSLPRARWRSHVPVFGHWAALGLDVTAEHIGLDTGCVWGRQLTAFRFEDRAVFQVKCVDAVE